MVIFKINDYICRKINNAMNTEKLNELVGAYKAHFNENIPNEIYKWQAVKCFQDNWDIEAEDFATMLSLSLSKT